MATTPTGPGANAVGVDMAAVEALVKELKAIRQRLKPEMRKVTAASAKRVMNRGKSNIRAQTSGKTTGWYPATITWEMAISNASLVHAVIGAEKVVGKRAPLLGLHLEFGTARTAPKPHMTPAAMAEVDPYTNAMADAGERAVFP